MLATGRQVLHKANLGHYAVGAFNINNLEFLQAVMNAAQRMKSPVIISTSEGAINYAGVDYLEAMVYTASELVKVPVVLHLDHGKDLNIIKRCIQGGYTSVMIDASHYDLEKNIAITRKVVNMAHDKGVSVEAELGTIGGVEESVKSRNIIYTDPDAAVEFVRKTKINSLAVAIGTSHGAYKFAGKAKLNLDILKEIKQRLGMPLVLHGASGVPKSLVEKAKKCGVRIGPAEGVPDDQIMKAVKLGINKINTDTDLRLSFTASLRETLKKHPEEFDPRHYLGPARDYVQKIVEHRMQVFGSRGKA